MTEPARTLGELIRRQALSRPDAMALSAPDGGRTFSRLEKASNQVGNALRAVGVSQHARVAILSRDSAGVYEALLGCTKAGAVAVPINWRLTSQEVLATLQDASAETVFVSAEFAATLQQALPHLPDVRHVVMLGDGGGEAPFQAMSRWAGEQPDAPLDVVVSEGDVAVQMYTSGTTGRLKGVELTHANLFGITRQYCAQTGRTMLDWGPGDVTLINLPIFHVGGLWFVIRGIESGGLTVLVDSFRPDRTIEVIARERVTKVTLVPSMMQMVMADPAFSGADLSSLTHVIYGGSPIAPAVLEEAISRFGCGFAQCYGMTETANVAVFLAPEHHHGEKLRAAGKPLPGVDVRVVDDRGAPLPARAVGEICLRSPGNMLGYWRQPDATRETLIDGWIHTGDAGYVDEEGFVYVSDRIKDMVISAGEKVFPAEIEAVIRRHPAVADVAVVGVPDDTWGETLKAFVVPVAGASPKATEIVKLARRSLAAFKIPSAFEFVQSLPRTASGKVRKGDLRARRSE